jgi:hypothetical protein
MFVYFLRNETKTKRNEFRWKPYPEPESPEQHQNEAGPQHCCHGTFSPEGGATNFLVYESMLSI